MDEKKRETSRIVFWDNLKFSLILLVVVGHFAEQYIKSGLFKSIFIFIYTEPHSHMKKNVPHIYTHF